MTKQFQSEAKLTFWTLKLFSVHFLVSIGGAPDKQEKPDLMDFHFELGSSEQC